MGLRIASIDAGGLRNAIPREASAHVTVKDSRVADFEALVAAQADVLKAEYAATDPGLEVLLEAADPPGSLLARDFQRKLLSAVYACLSGVFRLSPEIEGLVQTSNSLARVLAKDGAFQIHCLVRSALDTEKLDLARSHPLRIGAHRREGGIQRILSRLDAPARCPNRHSDERFVRGDVRAQGVRARLPRGAGVRHRGGEIPGCADDFLRTQHPRGALPG